VAHRVTAIQHADEIIVLEQGRIVERGDHETLLERGGVYADMARRQELEEGLARRVAGREIGLHWSHETGKVSLELGGFGGFMGF